MTLVTSRGVNQQRTTVVSAPHSVFYVLTEMQDGISPRLSDR